MCARQEGRAYTARKFRTLPKKEQNRQGLAGQPYLTPILTSKAANIESPPPDHRPCLVVKGLNASPDVYWDLEILSQNAPEGDPGEPVVGFLEVDEGHHQGAQLVGGSQKEIYQSN